MCKIPAEDIWTVRSIVAKALCNICGWSIGLCDMEKILGMSPWYYAFADVSRLMVAIDNIDTRNNLLNNRIALIVLYNVWFVKCAAYKTYVQPMYGCN